MQLIPSNLVTKEAINSELDIWCTKWQRHKLEGNDLIIF